MCMSRNHSSTQLGLPSTVEWTNRDTQSMLRNVFEMLHSRKSQGLVQAVTLGNILL